MFFLFSGTKNFYKTSAETGSFLITMLANLSVWFLSLARYFNVNEILKNRLIHYCNLSLKLSLFVIVFKDFMMNAKFKLHSFQILTPFLRRQQLQILSSLSLSKNASITSVIAFDAMQTIYLAETCLHRSSAIDCLLIA